MIYLIGGSPRCGKTKVAKRLAEQIHVPWFPVDYLCSVIFEYIADSEFDKKFPLVAIRKQNPTNDFRFSQYTSDEIVSFYHTQAESVWPGLSAFIKYAVHDGQDFILDGYQITPELINKLDEVTREKVKPVFLYKSDLVDIEAGFKKNDESGDWLIKNTHDEETYLKAAEMVEVFGARTKNEAQSYNFPVFNMDGNFDEKVRDVVKYLALN